MKKRHALLTIAACLSLVVASSQDSYAQRGRARARTQTKKTATRRRARPTNELSQAMNLARRGQYAAAATKLFQLGLSPRYASKRTQIRYLLGLTLYQLKMNQTAAFQFISVIRSGDTRYLRQSLEKLSIAADTLGDETLLNYAISRVKAEQFPAVHRDMLFFRIGEFQMRNQQYDGAIRSFSQVTKKSSLFDKAQYLRAYAYAVSKRPKQAVQAFQDILEYKTEAPVNETARVAALMGKARALYQMKEWDLAIEAYREVPRDSEMWHDTLFESSWAMLRSGRFRSALSNFQSLHSPYYEETYLPESLLLRSIVYLYICQYDEMDKVLNLFNRIYRPVFKDVTSYVKTVRKANQYFADVVKVLVAAEKPNFDPTRASFPIPYVVVQKVIKEGDFQRSYDYIKNLLEERRRIQQQSPAWRASSLGKYALRTVERRIQRARSKAGRQIRAHMLNIRTELIDLFEQEGFIRYEMLNGKKEALKKRVAGKQLPDVQVNEDTERDYYVQNGYQYWTFRGEYWLDELGNYHYVGTQSCQ